MMSTFIGAHTSVETSQPAFLGVLAAFVAINTLMYVCLAIAKMLPRLRLPRALRRAYSRAETRSIFPNKAP
jgi:hypothetical protein